MNKTIACEICGEQTPHIGHHLKTAHPGMTVAEYQEKFPNAPLTSPAFDEQLRAKLAADKRQENLQVSAIAKILPTNRPGNSEQKPLHEVFELPLTDDYRKPPAPGQTQGDPRMVQVLTGLDPVDMEAVPEIDDGYVYRAEELNNALMALQLNIPLMLWGLHGSGKTTLIEQLCARTNRPTFRVQHTDTTEEAHIIGQMVVRNGGTEFEYGPLAEAMMRGYTYIADEYDFAHPAVIAVYQAVLEGKPLFIKEAPANGRLIKPHENFRFVATGNTNGSGDDTGLYSGTKIGNAAAYSRFGVTIQVHYPEPKVEASILCNRVGVTQDIADKLVDFATRIRAMYQSGEISLPISPRELIRASTIAVIRGGMFRLGIDLAYANRLNATEGESVRQTAQRIFSN